MTARECLLALTDNLCPICGNAKAYFNVVCSPCYICHFGLASHDNVLIPQREDISRARARRIALKQYVPNIGEA